LLALVCTPALAVAPDCVIADPTDTPLNLRRSPNGTILGALHNDTGVVILNTVLVNGKKWAHILALTTITQEGWVFSNYLDCSQAEQQQEQIPLPRSRPPEAPQEGWDRVILHSQIPEKFRGGWCWHNNEGPRTTYGRRSPIGSCYKMWVGTDVVRFGDKPDSRSILPSTTIALSSKASALFPAGAKTKTILLKEWHG
jgi:hypothetical protein